jgi:hypothetical protein
MHMKYAQKVNGFAEKVKMMSVEVQMLKKLTKNEV